MTDVKEEQFINRLVDRVLMVLGREIYSKLEQSLKALLPIVVILLGRLTYFK